MANSVWITLSGGGAFSGQQLGPAASNIAAPPFSFLGDLTSGYGSSAVGTLDLVTAGVSRAQITSTGFTLSAGVMTVINTPSAQMIVSGWEEVAGLFASSGQILIGNNSTNQGRIHYEAKNNAYLYIDNSFDVAGSSIYLRTRTAGTAVNSLILTPTAATFIGTIAGTGYNIGTTIVISGTAPTISSGFGTTPSIVASNGTAAFQINVGTGGTASSGVIGLPTATTGWVVSVVNLTAVAANRADQQTVQTASATTTATVQNQTISTGAALAWAASDKLWISAVAY